MPLINQVDFALLGRVGVVISATAGQGLLRQLFITERRHRVLRGQLFQQSAACRFMAEQDLFNPLRAGFGVDGTQPTRRRRKLVREVGPAGLRFFFHPPAKIAADVFLG